jgi:hypothetical protein
MGRDKGQVRRSQLITTYGVGSIMAVEDESFMVAGIDQWDVLTPNMHEPRLEKELRVDGFVLPPESGSGVKVPVVRFPLWYSCPGCDTLNEHRFFAGKWDNRCNACGQNLIPSRFVTVCRRGHIDDFPYFHWVHRGHPKSDASAHRMSSSRATAAYLPGVWRGHSASSRWRRLGSVRVGGHGWRRPMPWRATRFLGPSSAVHRTCGSR